jgi:hypothetical protein
VVGDRYAVPLVKIEIDPKNVRILGDPARRDRPGLPFRYRLYIAGALAAAEFALVVSGIVSWFHWYVAVIVGFVLIAGWWELRRRIRSARIRQATQIVALSQVLLAVVLVVVPVSVLAAGVVAVVAILMAAMLMLGRRA